MYTDLTQGFSLVVGIHRKSLARCGVQELVGQEEAALLPSGESAGVSPSPRLLCSPSGPKKCTGYSPEPFPSWPPVMGQEKALFNRQPSLGVSKELRK